MPRSQGTAKPYRMHVWDTRTACSDQYVLYQYYDNASVRLSELTEIYQLYQDLLQSDGKASINEEGTVISVIHNKDIKYGLPEQVTYHLSEDMREHLFLDNGISFVYYDNQLDELIKEITEKEKI
ncbi:MAG: hypothetical protein ACI4FX_10940 [Agathobacter sp.]